ncbi:hypothetical protein YIM1627_20620 [Thermus oshimai]
MGQEEVELPPGPQDAVQGGEAQAEEEAQGHGLPGQAHLEAPRPEALGDAPHPRLRPRDAVDVPLDAPHVPHHQEELFPVLPEGLHGGASPVVKPKGVGDGRAEAEVVVKGHVGLALGVRGHQAQGLLEGQGQVGEEGLPGKAEAGHLRKAGLEALQEPAVGVLGDVGPFLGVEGPCAEAGFRPAVQGVDGAIPPLLSLPFPHPEPTERGV